MLDGVMLKDKSSPASHIPGVDTHTQLTAKRLNTHPTERVEMNPKPYGFWTPSVQCLPVGYITLKEHLTSQNIT